MQNIHLPDNVILDPTLAPLVQKLALERPQWVFNMRFSNKNAGNQPTSTRSQDGKTNAPEGQVFAYRVRVVQDSTLLGELGVEYAYWGRYRGTGVKAVFTVKSWRLEAIRSRGSTSKTGALDVAVRLAKKYFQTMSLAELWERMASETRSAFSHAMSDVQRTINNARLAPAGNHMQMFCYCVVNKLSVDPQLHVMMHTAFASDKFREALAQYQLGMELEQAARAKKLTTVHILQDGNVLHEDPTTQALVAKPMAELPDHWQSHIAVLRLVQDNELVRNVGFRLNVDNLVIVAHP